MIDFYRTKLFYTGDVEWPSGANAGTLFGVNENDDYVVYLIENYDSENIIYINFGSSDEAHSLANRFFDATRFYLLSHISSFRVILPFSRIMEATHFPNMNWSSLYFDQLSDRELEVERLTILEYIRLYGT